MELDDFKLKNNLNKPVSVTIIGWLFIFISLIQIFSLVCFSMFGTQLLGFNIKFSFFQLFIPVALIYVSIFFLRYKEWARLSLEIFCWLALFGLTALMVFLSNFIYEVNGHKLFDEFFSLTSFVIIVIFFIPTLIILLTLRGNTIKKAMI
jgi:hypothetical protein